MNFFLLDDANDYLTCGKCLSEFPLKNIVTFIEHKKKDCDVLSSGEAEPGDALLSNQRVLVSSFSFLAHLSQRSIKKKWMMQFIDFVLYYEWYY